MSGPTVTVSTSPLAPLKKPDPPPPNPFKIDSNTKLEDWKKWQISFRYYAHAINLDQKSHDVQISTFKSLVGPDAMEIYNTFSILDITDVESVMRKFDDHFKPKVNVVLERYKLYKLHQKSGQKFDDYLTDVTNQVDKCEFSSMRDEIILYKIVGGIDNDEIRNALLSDGDLRFDSAVQICRASSAMHFMSGKDHSRKKKTVEFDNALEVVLTEGVRKTRKGPVPKVKKAAKQKQECEEKENPEGETKSAEPAGPSKEEFLSEYIKLRPSRSTQKDTKITLQEDGEGSADDGGASDGDDDDWRGVDDQYEIEIGPSATSGDEEGKKDKNKRKKQDDPKRRKWLKKKKLRKRLYATLSKRLPCDMCDKTFRMEVSLDRHRKSHLPAEQKDVTCYHCGKVYKKNFLRRHMNIRHSDILGLPGPHMFACDVCHFTTRFPANLEKHKFQHTGEKPLACEQCDYKCITVRLLKAHVAKMHTGERPFTCSVCNRGFLHSDALKRHMVVHQPRNERTQHLIQIKCTCDTCGKIFSTKSALQTHMLRHKGEKPFACHFCEFRTVTNGALGSHILSKHSDEKPFVCTVCGYSCKQRTVLKQHMLTHSAEKPHSCEICGRKFSQITHVKRHMLVHTGEKPHVCEICGHRWAQKENLKAHMKVHQKQSGDPTQYTPPRKRQKKVVAIVAAQSDESGHSAEPAAQADAIIQWSEQVNAINSIEYTPNLETPPPFHPSYPVHQGNPRPADCRFYQQRQWPNQGYR